MTRHRLEWSEIRLGAALGVERVVADLERGYHPGAGQESAEVFTAHIMGALGEYLVARVVDCFPSASMRLGRGGDVARWEVRTTSRPRGRLIIRPGDPDDRPFVLVRGFPPVLEIVGVILGREAKREQWLYAPNGRPPAYFPPDNALTPLAEALP